MTTGTHVGLSDLELESIVARSFTNGSTVVCDHLDESTDGVRTSLLKLAHERKSSNQTGATSTFLILIARSFGPEWKKFPTYTMPDMILHPSVDLALQTSLKADDLYTKSSEERLFLHWLLQGLQCNPQAIIMAMQLFQSFSSTTTLQAFCTRLWTGELVNSKETFLIAKGIMDSTVNKIRLSSSEYVYLAVFMECIPKDLKGYIDELSNHRKLFGASKHAGTVLEEILEDKLRSLERRGLLSPHKDDNLWAIHPLATILLQLNLYQVSQRFKNDLKKAFSRFYIMRSLVFEGSIPDDDEVAYERQIETEFLNAFAAVNIVLSERELRPLKNEAIFALLSRLLLVYSFSRGEVQRVHFMLVVSTYNKVLTLSDKSLWRYKIKVYLEKYRPERRKKISALLLHAMGHTCICDIAAIRISFATTPILAYAALSTSETDLQPHIERSLRYWQPYSKVFDTYPHLIAEHKVSMRLFCFIGFAYLMVAKPREAQIYLEKARTYKSRSGSKDSQTPTETLTEIYYDLAVSLQQGQLASDNVNAMEQAERRIDKVLEQPDGNSGIDVAHILKVIKARNQYRHSPQELRDVSTNMFAMENRLNYLETTPDERLLRGSIRAQILNDIQTFHETDDFLGLKWSHMTLAQECEDAGRWADAQEHYEELVSLSSQIHNDKALAPAFNEGTACWMAGICAIYAGSSEIGWNYVQRAIEILRPQINTDALSRLQMAQIYSWIHFLPFMDEDLRTQLGIKGVPEDRSGIDPTKIICTALALFYHPETIDMTKRIGMFYDKRGVKSRKMFKTTTYGGNSDLPAGHFFEELHIELFRLKYDQQNPTVLHILNETKLVTGAGNDELYTFFTEDVLNGCTMITNRATVPEEDHSESADVIRPVDDEEGNEEIFEELGKLYAEAELVLFGSAESRKDLVYFDSKFKRKGLRRKWTVD